MAKSCGKSMPMKPIKHTPMREMHGGGAAKGKGGKGGKKGK